MPTAKLPNVYYQACDIHHLRLNHSFTALPPVDSILLADVHSYRYIRQDDPLWAQLHQGVLTTGNINAALGFYEPITAVPHNKQLKPHKDRVGHRAILSVAQHLTLHEYIPQCNTHLTPEQVEEHNKKVLYAYNDNNNNNNSNNIIPPPTTTTAATTTTTSSITEDTKLKKARSMQSLGLIHCRKTWGKVQEAASIYALMKLFPYSLVSEIGMCRVDHTTELLLKSWGFNQGDLPPLGASPDAIIEHFYNDNKDEDEDEDEDEEESELKMARLSLQDDDNTSTASSNGSNIGRRWKEIVEIKNTCPFNLTKTGRGREYIVSDKGPRSHVDPLWIPQLQLHMLCAGTASGLLVSRSATMGIRVMRVQRDDEYLKFMLGCVRALYARVKVKGGKGGEGGGRYPPADFYVDGNMGKEHKRLVEKTIQLAKKAVIVVEVEDNIHPVGGDDRLFL